LLEWPVGQSVIFNLVEENRPNQKFIEPLRQIPDLSIALVIVIFSVICYLVLRVGNESFNSFRYARPRILPAF